MTSPSNSNFNNIAESRWGQTFFTGLSNFARDAKIVSSLAAVAGFMWTCNECQKENLTIDKLIVPIVTNLAGLTAAVALDSVQNVAQRFIIKPEQKGNTPSSI